MSISDKSPKARLASDRLDGIRHGRKQRGLLQAAGACRADLLACVQVEIALFEIAFDAQGVYITQR